MPLPGDEAGFARLEQTLRTVLAPEALLFDLDGVIADVRESFRAAIVATAARFGVTVSDADITKAKAAGKAAPVERVIVSWSDRPLTPEEFEKLQRLLACMRMLCDTPYILDPACRDSPKLEELERWLQGELQPAVSGQRSVPAALGQGAKRLMLRLLDLPVPAHMEKAAETFRYNRRVFIAPPWPEIFTQDSERKQTLAEAERTDPSWVEPLLLRGRLALLLTTTSQDPPDRRRFMQQGLEHAERALHLARSATGPDETAASLLEQAARSARARGAPDAAAELAQLSRRLTPNGSRSDAVRRALDAIGGPIVALLLALLFSFWSLGYRQRFTRDQILKFANDCLAPTATILLIIGAGGGFNRVLLDSGVGKAIADLAVGTNASPLLLAWTVAALIRVATGSATVAMTTSVQGAFGSQLMVGGFILNNQLTDFEYVPEIDGISAGGMPPMSR